MSFVNTHICDIGVFAPTGLSIGNDGRLWLFDNIRHSVATVDPVRFTLDYHFTAEPYCTFGCFGDVGAIGTLDGTVLRFSLNDPRLVSSEVRVLGGRAVGSIDYDPYTDSLFVLCNNTIFHISADGVIHARWTCSFPAFCIKWVEKSRTMWSVCDGIEIWGASAENSIVMNQGRLCPYGEVAVSVAGDVACFGGDVDVFTAWGEPVKTISGDYNHGAFDTTGRLFVQEVSSSLSDKVTISSFPTHAVVSMCDCFAIDQSGNRLAALHRGKLFLFSRSAS